MASLDSRSRARLRVNSCCPRAPNVRHLRLLLRKTCRDAQLLDTFLDAEPPRLLRTVMFCGFVDNENVLL